MSLTERPPGWVRLENRFYGRTTFYSSLKWSLSPADISGSLSACAPNGGPVAVISDAGWGLSSALVVYSASGVELSRYDFLRETRGSPSRAVALGWTGADRVVVVYEDGFLVRVRLMAAVVEKARVGKLVPVTPLAGGEEDGHPERLFDAVVLPQGQVVVRTVGGDMFSVVEGEKPSPLPSPLPRASVPPPKSMLVDGGGPVQGTIVATALNQSPRALDVEALVIGEGGSLARVNATACVPVVGDHVHQKLALSPDGKFLAAALPGGHVVVRNISSLAQVVHVVIPAQMLLTGDEDSHLAECDHIAWVGPDAVAVAFGRIVLLVGPGGALARANLETASAESLVLHTESDGLRLVSADTCEFIQMVPDVVEALFCSQTSPGNKLYRAACASSAVGFNSPSSVIQQGDVEGSDQVSALERYRLLADMRQEGAMHKAARDCVEAAYLTWEPSHQKALLNAAAYGQRFGIVLGDGGGNVAESSSLPSGTRGRGQERAGEKNSDCGVPLAVATLRLLNMIRSADCGLPMTKPQLDSLGYPGLVLRLSGYGNHKLALRVASFCGVSANDALAGWARAHMLGNDSDDDVAEHIISHFQAVRRELERPGAASQLPPYTLSARDAFESGRSRTAELLLRKEVVPAVKVPLYLEMRLESLALLAAMASKDNEVVMDVAGHLLEQKTVRELAAVFDKLPASMSHRATDMLVEYFRETDQHEKLRTLLSEQGRHREAAMDVVSQVVVVSGAKARLSAMEKAASSLGRWSTRRSNAFELQSLQHAIASAQNAADLEKRQGLEPGSLYEACSSELLSVAARISDPNRRRDALTRLRRDLKIPDRRFFWVVLESLAEARELPAVEALSNSAGHGRPPPIGLMAFVDVCLRYGEEAEAMKYALRIADLRDRARALARCGRGKEAAEIASKLRNQQLMEEVEALVARHSMSSSGSVTSGL